MYDGEVAEVRIAKKLLVGYNELNPYYKSELKQNFASLSVILFQIKLTKLKTWGTWRETRRIPGLL